MKMTIKQLNEKRNYLGLLAKIKTGLSVKVLVAIRTLDKRMKDAVDPAGEVLNEKLDEARIRHAMCGENGALLLADGNYHYTPEGMMAMQREQKAAVKEFEAVVVDVSPVKLSGSDIPEDIDPVIQEELKGLLF